MKRTLLFLLMALGLGLLAVLWSAGGANAQPPAQTTATPEADQTHDEDSEAAAEYCTEQGGTVTSRYPAYNTNAPESAWLHLSGTRDFCTFFADADESGFRSQIEIALDTLYAEEPTLAALAYLEPVALPPFTGANPSTLYCQKLGGTDIWGGTSNAAGGGWVTEETASGTPTPTTPFQIVGMCVFPDMSAIDSWGLTYKANDVIRGTDLAKVMRYQPTSLPHVFVSGSSPNAPAQANVDQTVTNADNNSDVTLKVGDTLSVELTSNPSTGYSWQVADVDDEVLSPVGTPEFNLGNKTPMPGAGGTETFTFKAIGEGTTTLKLVYVRPWETDVTPTAPDVWSVDVTVE